MNRRLLLVGLDAVDPGVLRRGLAVGLYPNIGALLDESTVSSLFCDGGVENLGLWTAMLCGHAVGEHGYSELWAWDPQHYRMLQYRPDQDMPYDPFWVALGRAGRHATMVDWPRSPLRPGPGVRQVNDWVQHYVLEPTRTTPPELAQELAALFPQPARCPDLDSFLSASDDLPAALERLRARQEKKVEWCCTQLLHTDWDFFGVCFSEAHDVGHRLWAIHDEGHPQHDAGLRARLGDPVEASYRWLDEAVGRLREAAGSDTLVVLSTGPGMEPNYSGNGLLDYYLTRRDGVDSSRFVDRPCFEVRNHPRSGAIRLNLRGRESQGRIDPASYDAFCDDLTDDLLGLVNLDSGQPVVENVIRSRQAYPGRRVDLLPDLYVVWNRAAPIRGFRSPDHGDMDFGSFLPRWTGDHNCEALFSMGGGGGGDWPLSAYEEFPALLGRVMGVDLERLVS